MGVARALDVARTLHLAVEIVGSGHVVSQDPPAGPLSASGGATRLTLRFSDDAQRIASLHEIGDPAR
jgi:hypothetical protein